MSRPADSRKGSDLEAGWADRLRRPLDLLSAAVEAVLSRRGLSVLFLVAAALFAAGGWLRPPLSPDIESVRVPLGLPGTEHLPGETVQASLRPTAGSVGVLLLVSIAAVAVVVFLRPDRLAAMAGVLLCVSVGAMAAACLNNPALIEELDLECEQRWQMVEMLTASEDNVLASTRNGRVSAEPVEASQRAGLFRGWFYLRHGPWLVLLAAICLLLSGRGLLRRRLGHLLLWILLGVALGALLCFQRLRAELYWWEAERQELRGDLAASREALEAAVGVFPRFDGLQRTWLLAGRLDHQQKRSSARARFFRAHQFARNEEWAQATAIMESLLAECGEVPPVRDQAARFLALAGLAAYEDERTGGALQAWQRAIEIDPSRLDCLFYLGTAQALRGRTPELAEKHFIPLLAGLADRVLRADALASLGDACFDAGRTREARKWYRESLREYDLPKSINYRARKGLVGL